MPVIKRKLPPEPPSIPATPDNQIHVAPRLLTLKQAAVYLQSSVYQVRQLIIDRKIPNLRLGKLYRLDRRDSDAFIHREKHLGARSPSDF